MSSIFIIMKIRLHNFLSKNKSIYEVALCVKM